MRKFLLLLLVCVFAYCSTANALGRVMVFEVNNTTGDYTTNSVPTTTVIPKKHRILGIGIVPNDPAKHSERVAGIYDLVWDSTLGTVGGNVAELIVENEVGDNGPATDWFDYPLSLNTQIIVNQGANTTVLIFYCQ